MIIIGAVLGAGAYALLGPGKAPMPVTAAFSPGSAPQAGVAPEGTFPYIANAVSPSVVNISATKLMRHGRPSRDDPFYEFFDDFFSPLYEFGLKKHYLEHSKGSGVIVSPDGYIMTNNHVVENAEKIKVTLLDKRVFSARVIGVDTKTDLAVVRISADELPYIRWGDSDALRVGDFAIAVGNPFGLSHTVTMGIISAVGRAGMGITDADYEDLIQTDAAINPGNSGGPLVNTRGELVGINTAIFSKSGGYQGIGFAVPSNMARLVMEQLVTSGRVVRGWLGVSMQELSPPLAKAFGHGSLKGVLVSDTMPGSPAREAGLENGDIIVGFGRTPVEGPAELRNLVAKSRPGQSAKLTVVRKGRKRTVEVEVGELPAEHESPRSEHMPEPMGDAFTGLSVIALTEDIARQLKLPKDAFGVVVAGVEEGSPGHEAGLKRGDVIHEIDGQRIQSLADFQRAASGVKQDETVLMYINREGRKFYITVLVS
jgi:serine protease Do